MASYIYGLGREAFLDGGISWSAANIKCLLVDSADYTPNQNTDQYHADVASGGIVATSGNFASKTVSLGVADAADVTLSSVSGDQAEYIIIYKDSGSSATSPLIAKIDDYTGLPVTPNGGNITISWPNDSNKIFKL